MLGLLLLLLSIIATDSSSLKFTKKIYSVKVPESTRYGEIVTVTASGSNSPLRYSISFTASRYVKQNFYMNPNTGTLFLRPPRYTSKPLDYEKTKRVDIPIQVQETTGGQSDEASILVQVQDINDNAPAVFVQTYYINEDRYVSLEIKENLPAPETLALIIVTDRDSGLNGQVDCVIGNVEKNLPFQLKRISDQRLKLIATRTFDSETGDTVFEVEVKCTDNGSPPLWTKKLINIQIKSINDNPPIFKNQSYHVAIYENTEPRKILQVTAKDKDKFSIIEAPFNRLLYSLDPALKTVFKIDENGIIYLLKKLNREQRSEYKLKVFAIDNDKPTQALTGTTTVTIQVLDVNDTPQFVNKTLNIKINENIKNGSVVGKVQAVDEDGHSLLYRQQSEERNVGTRMWRILYDGTIILKNELVKEQDDWNFTVLAVDNGEPSQTATATVFIQVADNVASVSTCFTVSTMLYLLLLAFHLL